MTAVSSTSFASERPSRNSLSGRFAWLLPCLAGLLAGCGSSTYQGRLNQTAQYFEYRQKVDDVLQPIAWREYGIEFRVPKGFEELPKPTEEFPDDHRQPPFLTQPLPGLVGAWRSDVRVEIPEVENGTLPAWLLLCTNHQRHLDRATDSNVYPGELHGDVSNVLADALEYKRDSALERWTFATERVPRGTAYVPRKSYDWIPLDGEVTLEGRTVRIEIRQYRYNVGEIQFSLVTVFPHADVLDRRERPDSVIAIAMETLTMTGDVPRPGTAAPASGGGF